MEMKQEKGVTIFGVELAPLSIPLHRRLETIGVIHFWFIFMLSGICGIAFCVVLLLTGYILTFSLLVSWVIFDYKTPVAGGRRSHFVRNWPLFKWMVNYFPMKLIKTIDLDPKHSYLFGYHPHGIMGMGLFAHFATEGSNFSEIFPGITPYPLTLHGWFRIPLVRDYLMSSGLCSVRKESLDWILSHPGNAAIIVVGGAREALEAKPGTNRLVLTPRKGFIKRAIMSGAHLVPVYSFGENDMFDQVDNVKNNRLKKLQNILTSIIGISPPMFHGRGLFNYNMGLMPHRVPIYTVVGKPLPVEKNTCPSQDEIDEVHRKYTEAVTKLFQDNKIKYGLKKEDCLEIL
ncbi:2-acylglycerol O-acyltransferase 1 [Holothuria leucospilota]|uniref:Acyltransferase n=1 Tax=Holothuria leucospilota TaxID=206669 RepID=A0A9Q1H3T8_HOLLE|nr:2-acylglycerol O-acyltransferase 1 [Holothuria leucospilota]